MRRNFVIVCLMVLMLASWGASATKGSGTVSTVPAKLTWDIQPNESFIYTLNSSMSVSAGFKCVGFN